MHCTVLYICTHARSLNDRGLRARAEFHYKGSSGQRNSNSGRGASVHRVAGSDEDYYNNVTTEDQDAPDKEGNLGEEGLGHQWEDEDGSWETVQQEYEGDYQE